MKPATTAYTQILKPKNGTMRGFARCTKARTAEDRASYYFGGYKCDKGEFNPATADTMEKRREKFEEWRNKRK